MDIIAMILKFGFCAIFVVTVMIQPLQARPRQLLSPSPTDDVDLDVCQVWKNAQDANYSYFVSISTDQGLHFCSGALISHDSVLTSYSCFQRIIQHIKQTRNVNLQNFPNNSKHFEILNGLNSSSIRVRTSVDNCAFGEGALENNLYALVQSGTIHPVYRKIKINQNFNKNFENQTSQLTVHANDFVILKLGASFSDVPVEKIKLSPIKYYNINNNTNSNNNTVQKIDGTKKDENSKIDDENLSLNEKEFEILTWVVSDTNFLLQFGYTNVYSESKNKQFKCSKQFLNQICKESQQISKDVLFVCGKFELPDIDLFSFHIHSGDLLVQKSLSDEATIYGIFSEDFLNPNLKNSQDIELFGEDYFTYKSGNYSLENTGAMFYGFTQENIDWIDWVLAEQSGSPQSTPTPTPTPKKEATSQQNCNRLQKFLNIVSFKKFFPQC